MMATCKVPPSRKRSPDELETLAHDTASAIEDNEYILVDPFPEEVQHKCPICLQIMKEPQMLTCCGNRFCLKCIRSVRSSKCPLCNTFLSQCYHDRQLERLIRHRMVYCWLRRDGCQWTGELHKLSDHFDFSMTRDHHMTCQYLPVKCHYCTKYVRRMDTEDHLKQCSHRTVQCEYCKEIFSWHLRSDHYKQCQKCPDICPNIQCSRPMQTWELDRHLEECLWTPLQCKYQSSGCDKIIFRKHMERHLQKDMARHLEMADARLNKLEEEVRIRGQVQFLVISDLPEDALDEHKLKSRFGQFGPVNKVQLLDPELKAGIVVFSSDDTYHKTIQCSRDGYIKFCREYVQANPVYTYNNQEEEQQQDVLQY